MDARVERAESTVIQMGIMLEKLQGQLKALTQGKVHFKFKLVCVNLFSLTLFFFAVQRGMEIGDVERTPETKTQRNPKKTPKNVLD